MIGTGHTSAWAMLGSQVPLTETDEVSPLAFCTTSAAAQPSWKEGQNHKVCLSLGQSWFTAEERPSSLTPELVPGKLSLKDSSSLLNQKQPAQAWYQTALHSSNVRWTGLWKVN